MKYFTIEELCFSQTAQRKKIDNSPDGRVRVNLTALVANILDPLREAYGKPIIVTSGYRCAKLNKAVGGVKNSQHLTGEAADIQAASKLPKDNKKIFELIQKLSLPFDQLIDEYGMAWVHVSYSSRNRRQVIAVK